jgi:hypothetical protein
MLTVTIDINGRPIEIVSARRTQELDTVQEIYEYEICQGGVHIGFVYHKYSDGAIALTKKVLEKAKKSVDIDDQI